MLLLRMPYAGDIRLAADAVPQVVVAASADGAAVAVAQDLAVGGAVAALAEVIGEYLAALLGFSRGRVPQARRSLPYEARFAAAVEGESQARPEHELRLKRQGAFDQARTRLFDLLADL